MKIRIFVKIIFLQSFYSILAPLVKLIMKPRWYHKQMASYFKFAKYVLVGMLKIEICSLKRFKFSITRW